MIEIERQKDRETERQRDRETERQRDRETERQRETERETEKERDLELFIQHSQTSISRERGLHSTDKLVAFKSQI